MCIDHDLQHYAIDLRNLAREITCGDKVLASRLLDFATHDGLAAFMEDFERYCPDARRRAIVALVGQSFRQRKGPSMSLSGDIINAWDEELSDMIPF